MKIFTFNKTHLVIFICSVLCICGIITVTIGGTLPANTTPATNKTVVLDARAWGPGLWYRK